MRTFALPSPQPAGVSTIGLAMTDMISVWVALRFRDGLLPRRLLCRGRELASTTPPATARRGRAACHSMKRCGCSALRRAPFILGFGLGGATLCACRRLLHHRHHPADALPAGGAASEPARFDALPQPDHQRRRWASLPAFVSGTVNAAFYGMSGVYGERAGLSQTEIAFFIAAMLIGPTIAHSGRRRSGRPDGAALDACC